MVKSFGQLKLPLQYIILAAFWIHFVFTKLYPLKQLLLWQPKIDSRIRYNFVEKKNFDYHTWCVW